MLLIEKCVLALQSWKTVLNMRIEGFVIFASLLNILNLSEKMKIFDFLLILLITETYDIAG